MAVGSWLVCSTLERAVRFRALAGDIVLCSWARHFTLTVPLSTQVYKWVPANCWRNLTRLRGSDLRWTNIPSRGSRNTSSRFMLQKPGQAPAAMSQSWLQGFLFFTCENRFSSSIGKNHCEVSNDCFLFMLFLPLLSSHQLPMMHNGEVNKTVAFLSHNRTGDCHGDGKNSSCITEIGRKQRLQSPDRHCLIIFPFSHSPRCIGLWIRRHSVWINKPTVTSTPKIEAMNETDNLVSSRN